MLSKTVKHLSIRVRAAVPWLSLCLLLCGSGLLLNASTPHGKTPVDKSRKPKAQAEAQYLGMHHAYELTENRGQWDDPIRFQSRYRNATIWYGQQSWVFHMTGDFVLPEHDPSEHDHAHGHGHHHGHAHGQDHDDHHLTDPNSPESLTSREATHDLYRMDFVGSNPQAHIQRTEASPGHMNYYLGERQATYVRSYPEVTYREFYTGIDMRVAPGPSGVKYDFILEAGADPSDIRIRYRGVESVEELKGTLRITTRVNEVRETIPAAWQMIHGDTVFVPCTYDYRAADTTVAFLFPEGYDPAYPLVIDPELTFSTYTGSVQDNWGFTATYDIDQHLYSGGIVRSDEGGGGTGVFGGEAFSGGEILDSGESIWFPTDIALVKYDPSTNRVLWGTIIGGFGNEQPHSMIANEQGELYVLGATRSSDFPMLANSQQSGFGGRIDAVIFRLSDNGLLTASTYLGGSGEDGINRKDRNALYKFYADDSRGEVVLDETGNVLVTSSTQSRDFPVQSALQADLRGEQDAFITKFSRNLDQMIFSTYFGGNLIDAGYSIKLDTRGDLVFVGGTESDRRFPAANFWLNDNNGGVDGFIARIRGNGSQLTQARFVGTPQYDQIFLVDLDDEDNVYVVGQSEGDFPIAGNPFFRQADTRQFVARFVPALNEMSLSTTFGAPNSQQPDITISAFLVDMCNNIYVSGWGGTQNSGSTANMQTTPDALIPRTDGRDFYLIVLKENASEMLYATFMGGDAAEHVDGGTSRFDKRGTVYQSVCASCGGFDDFPTSPESPYPDNGSTNCNNAAFVFRFDILDAAIADFRPDPFEGCGPLEVNFENLSENAESYEWDFGDGETSTEETPTHTYRTPGTYRITLRAMKTGGCVESDEIERVIVVTEGPSPVSAPDIEVCQNEDIEFQISMGDDPGDELYFYENEDDDQPVDIQPVSNPDEAFTYAIDQLVGDTTIWVEPRRDGCAGPRRPLRARVILAPPAPVAPDIQLCDGGILTFSATVAEEDIDEVTLFDEDQTSVLAQIQGQRAVYELTTPQAVRQSRTFYLQSRRQNCLSPLQPVEAIIDITPAPPITADQEVCDGGPVDIQPRMGNPAGSEMAMFDAPQGGAELAVRRVPYRFQTPDFTTTTTYYFEARNGDCISDRSPVEIVVTPTPPPPSAGDIAICDSGAVTFTARMGSPAGEWIRLYAQPSQASRLVDESLGSQDTHFLDSDFVRDTTDFYLQTQLRDCPSDFAPVQLIIIPTPPIPPVTDTLICQADSVQLEPFPGFPTDSLFLYPDPNTSEPADNSGNGQFRPVYVGRDTTLYLQACNAQCCTPQVPYELKVVPPLQIESDDLRLCGQPRTTTIPLRADEVRDASYLWQAPGGNVLGRTRNVDLPNAGPSANGTYRVTATVPGCPPQDTTIEVRIFLTPEVVADNNGPICPGNTLQLTALADLTGVTFTWSGPDGWMAISPNPQIPSAQEFDSGVYEVFAERDGCRSEPFGTDVMIESELLPVNIDRNGPVCEGDTIRLFASSNDPLATYQWKGPAGFRSNRQNPIITPAQTVQTGWYELLATAEGCEGTDSVFVEVIETPQISLCCTQQLVCAGQNINLNCDGLASYDYQWFPPNNQPPLPGQNLVIPNASDIHRGVWSVSAMVNGCPSETLTTSVFVLNVPPPQLDAPRLERCGVGLVTITATTEPGYTIEIYDDDNNFRNAVSGPRAEIPWFSSEPRERVWLQAVSPEGCISERIPVEIEQLPQPGPPVVENITRCGTGDVTITALMGTPPGRELRLLDGSRNLLDTDPGPGSPYVLVAPDVQRTTTYFVESVADGNCANSNPVPVVVRIFDPLPPPSLPEELTVCGGGQIAFTLAAPGATAVRLYAGDTVYRTGTPPNFNLNTPPVTGTTTFQITTIGPGGCESERFPLPARAILATPPMPDPTFRCGAGRIRFTFSGVRSGELRLYNPGGSVVDFDTDSLYVLETPVLNQTTTFQVEYVSGADNCVSERAPVIARVFDEPPGAPQTGIVARCGPGPVSFTARMGTPAGDVMNLYDVVGNPVAGVQQVPGPLPRFFLPNVQATTTYYVESENTVTGCVSERTEVEVLIQEVPQLVKLEELWRCGGGRVVLTINIPDGVQEVRLYSQPSGGQAQSTGVLRNPGDEDIRITTPILTTNTTYYLAPFTPGCGEGPREEIKINVGAFLNVQTQVTPAINGNDGIIVASVSGGFPPYRYALDDGTLGPQNRFTGLQAGEYALWVRDSRNCAATEPVVVPGNFCDPPIDIRTIEGDDDRVYLTWSEVPGAERYELQYRLKGSTDWSDTLRTPINEQVLTRLLPERLYEVRVRAICVFKASVWSPGEFMTPICNSVNFIYMSDVTDSRGVVNWSDMLGAVGYEFRWQEQGAPWTPIELLETTRRPLENLDKGTTYNVGVRTVCFGGSVIADEVFWGFTTLNCAEVTNIIRGEVTSTTAQLSWSPVPNVTTYEVRYIPVSGGSWQTQTTTDPRVQLTGLIPDTRYRIQIRSICGEFSGPVTPTELTTRSVESECVLPTQVRVTSITGNTALLSWVRSPGAVTYNVRYRVRGSGDAGWEQATSFSPYLIQGLSPDTEYEVEVRAICGITTSGWTDLVMFRTRPQRAGNEIQAARVSEVGVYPNPNHGTFTLAFDAPQAGTAQVAVYDLTGRAVLRRTIEAQAGAQSVELTLDGVAAGAYLLSFTWNDQPPYRVKIVVQD